MEAALTTNDPAQANTDAFLTFAAEIADGERWTVLRADGWDDLQERLAQVIGDLPARRRQALIMLLFALIEEYVTPEEVRQWIDTHDLAGDDGVEQIIAWLRQSRTAREPGPA